MDEIIRRKCFISHYKGDRYEVDAFIKQFSHVFIPKVLGANDNDDFIESSDSDYVMGQIRKKYLGDSTVTIVLLGTCTHSRRYVDWEIKGSLRRGDYTPNGLLGIALPSAGTGVCLPPRILDNWNKNHQACYARCYFYPSSAFRLYQWIKDAHFARKNRSHLIVNSQSRMFYNQKCKKCGVTH